MILCYEKNEKGAEAPVSAMIYKTWREDYE